MAIFNEILVGRWNRAVQKIFAIKGSPPLRQLGGELTPTIGLTKHGAREFRVMFSENMYGVENSVVGVAASTSFIRFTNPAKSGILAIVERIVLRPAAAGQGFVLLKDITSPDIAGTQGDSLDGRQLGRPAVVLSGSTIGVVTAGTTLAQFVRSTIDSFDIINKDEDFLMVPPGKIIGVSSTVQNTALNVTFWWRERALEESESIN